MSDLYDIIVIGGGSGGYAAARTAATSGHKVALVESSPTLGGLCILRGCMPTKALLESAHRLHEIRHAKDFGLHTTSPRASWPEIIRRKNILIDDFASYRAKQLTHGKFDFIRGHASFISPHALLVQTSKNKSRIIGSKTFIIATGSVIAKREIPGLTQTGFWTSDDAIQINKPFKSLIVLGGRAVALEFAQYFARLGVKVTILQRSERILPNHDPDISSELTRAFTDEGIEVITGTKLLSASKKENLKCLAYEQNGKRKTVSAEHILNALGRDPATASLGLDKAKVKTSGLQIQASLTQQTSQPHIFAAGDVCGPYEVVHIAIQQGEIAARNAIRLLSKKRSFEKIDYRLKTDVIFTHPEVASVGLTETEAKEQGIPHLSASYPFNDHGKSMIMGIRHGFVKIIAEKKRGVIIGAQIIGPSASDLIHEFIVAMNYRATVHEFKNIPHYHPTLAEIVTYPAEEISETLAGSK